MDVIEFGKYNGVLPKEMACRDTVVIVGPLANNAASRMLLHDLENKVTLLGAVLPGVVAIAVLALVRNARLREIGTRNLLAAAVAAGVERMVAQSMAFVYAPGPMPYREVVPLMLDDPGHGETARAVARLEQQVLAAPLTGIVLRYGKLYGPGTGFDLPPSGSPLHVDDAADVARRALTRGQAGIYSIAEEDGTVSIRKATDALGWVPGFGLDDSKH